LQRTIALGVLLFSLLPLTLVAGAPANAAGGPARLGASACRILDLTGESGEVGHGHQVIRQQIFDGCSDSSCWSPYEGPEGERKCAYGRSALLTLGRADTPGQARRVVSREFGKGYRKVRIGADLAGMILTAKGGGIEMAVGRSTALFSLASASDNDPSPTWVKVRRELIEDAEEIAAVLGSPGCPVDANSCR
jgi:hypothetical protein